MYDIIDTPIGRLLVLGRPITAIAFETEDWDALLAAAGNPARTEHADARRQIADYLEGTRTTLDLEHAGPGSTPLRERVWDLLTRIPYGETRTYADVARELGTGAVRAVGSACAANPLPLLVPCHRVIRSDGSLGGYRGGLEAKRYLLDLESARRTR